MDVVVDSPPYTPVEPFTEVFHGVEVTDPYHWLEDQHSERTRQWLKEQTQYARSYLDAIPGRERIRRRVAELLDVERIDTPCKVGNRYFFLKREVHQDQPVVCMREGADREDQVLVDPAFMGDSSDVSVRIVDISPDGKLLAYGVTKGGEDSSAVKIMNIRSRETLPDRLAHGFLSGFAFTSDSKSYCYVHEVIGSPCPHYRAAYLHFIENDETEDHEIFVAGESPHIRLGMRISHDRRYIAYVVLRFGTTITIDLYVQDLFRRSPARLIAEGMEDPFYPYLLGEQLIVLTRWQAPNGRIVAIDPDSPSKATWRELIPESTSPIKDITVSGDKLFVSYVENISVRTDIYDLSGRKLGAIPYVGCGSARLFHNPIPSEKLFYAFTSFVHPETVFSYDIATGQQEIWSQNEVAFDPTSIEVKQIRYQSKDDTLVPMFLVSKRGLQKSGCIPTILTGYGGFGKSVTPRFSVFATFLVELGFLFAVANIRGGSELGDQWHKDGKRHKRQNAFDDFIAAAEWLIQTGNTVPDKLAIAGGSNGGLLVGAALTQRPDLFRAVVCIGPLLDMLRYHRARCGELWVDEYGSAANPADFPYLQSFSPYENVKPNVEYPAVLLVSGDADTRCDPMHARKMTARLQSVAASDKPILLGYSALRGHMPVLPLSERIEALTDRLAFLCNQLEIAI